MMKKRILAICMALCMMLSAVPVAFAAEGDAPIFEISDAHDTKRIKSL